jgi:hypothetical protein
MIVMMIMLLLLLLLLLLLMMMMMMLIMIIIIYPCESLLRQYVPLFQYQVRVPTALLLLLISILWLQ